MAESGSKIGGFSREDLVQLTKARLSALVVLTTAAGYVSATQLTEQAFNFWTLANTIIGTLFAAFGAAVFNQLMEIDRDAKMKRTADRPLPAGRIPPIAAFGLGWVLCALGMVHLGNLVGGTPAWLAGATIAVYIFAYTPLKRRSSWNTIVGAVSGAIPPAIGWTAGGGGVFDIEAGWWFALLFFWQLPHFFAINWVHRGEYKRAGFVMLANSDDTGRKTSSWALIFALALVGLAIAAPWLEMCSWWSLIPGLAAALALVWLSLKFVQERSVKSARIVFFGTLIYLPVALATLLLL
ncbi:MAG: protoheme IX farnesyltransferase [Verrucomicrobiales bacterium]|jgi:protoheme IX farnesyltransferase